MADRFEQLIDPYRWMETDRTAVEAWLFEQHARSDAEHDPKVRQELRDRLAALVSSSSTLGEMSRVGEDVFYTRVDNGRRLLWACLDGDDRLVLDPESIAPGTTLLSWSVSFGQRYVAANLAPGGDEIGVVYIYELSTRRALRDRIDGVHKDFSVEWIDDRAVLYSAIDRSRSDRMVEMRLWLHELGAANDRPLLDNISVAPGEFPFVQTTAPHSPWLIACITSARSAMRVYAARLTERRFEWQELATYSDDVEDVRVAGKQLYLLSSSGAPNRRLDCIDLATGTRTTIVVESPVVIEGFAIARDGVYLRGNLASVSQLQRVAHDGRVTHYALPRAESITRLTADPRSDGAVIAIESWTRPTRLVEYRDSATRELGVVSASPSGYAGTVADFVDVPSFDGEIVPLTVLRSTAFELDGSHPTIVEAYGGYGMSLVPSCDPLRLAWIERGGVYAIAHVRGGGEKGRAWYLAGKGANKLNSVRDLIACARALCERGYSRPERLAATGLSMGALVVGGAMIHAPAQFAAIAIHAGMLNPLRYLHSVNGEAQAEELGSPDHEAGYDALVAMDVYHGISDETRYPPVLLSVGINDERVSPWMTAKLAARLLANGNPVALRADHDGHGMTATLAQTANRLADTWAFFAAHLRR